MTKAMKMVAASRLKKAKQAVESSRPYAEKIQEVVSELVSNVSGRGNLNDKFPLLTGKGKDKTHLIVILSSDRGLCGGLNTATVKFAKNHIDELISKGHEVKILCVGKKAYDQLRSLHGEKIVDTIFGVFRGIVDHESAEKISKNLIEKYDKDEFDVCEVIYSKFKSAMVQDQICKQLIPVQVESKEDQEQVLESSMRYESGQEQVLGDLLPKNLTVQIYNELLENSASEQGARMAAMEAASNNAGKMIKGLTLVYNRTRQANITKELIDIISGANTV